MSVSKKNSFSDLITLTEIIYNINKDNIDTSISSLCKFYDNSQTYSFNLIICRFIYTMFVAKLIDIDIVIEFLNLIDREINKNQFQILDIFSRFLQENNTQESNYLIGKLIEKGLINSSITENMKSLFFSHFKAHFVLDNRYQFSEYFSKNLEKLQANDWELHKKYVKEGINPNEIAKIIRNDEIEKLQEISSQPNFDFNKTIEPSLYERCSFINKKNVSLIDYAAFFGSVKCFKYLLMNGAKLDNTVKYAVADGNEEIIHLCEQNHSSFESTYEIAIEFHRNNIFKYLYENKIERVNDLEKLGKKCIFCSNFDILSFLIEKGMEINENIIIALIVTGNLYIVQYFLERNPIPIDFLKISGFSGNVELSNYLINNRYIDLSKIVCLFYWIFIKVFYCFIKILKIFQNICSSYKCFKKWLYRNR